MNSKKSWKVNELIEMARTNWKLLPKAVADTYESGDLIFLNDAISINDSSQWKTAKDGELDIVLSAGGETVVFAEEA